MSGFLEGGLDVKIYRLHQIVKMTKVYQNSRNNNQIIAQQKI